MIVEHSWPCIGGFRRVAAGLTNRIPVPQAEGRAIDQETFSGGLCAESLRDAGANIK